MGLKIHVNGEEVATRKCLCRHTTGVGGVCDNCQPTGAPRCVWCELNGGIPANQAGVSVPAWIERDDSIDGPVLPIMEQIT